ncbi:Fasciclin-like arabinogalactan protein 14 [Apostasia shenzhenica]|uniref:Fasciclin-like arabinogalactan protein 14 n=1 Tax=Apostasia shenzhenica TaxID=1088818 RepID=A0A2I0A784_9ASPA|nr:Fasciclin-like arabinogalactan protein 14 [Apostasia shenzhenica]
MTPMAAASLPLLLVLLLAGGAAAHNITRLLSDYPDFSTFNSLLSQTKLADEINSRRTITVLAVPNGAVGSVAGLSSDIQRRVLSVHVILDYYDLDKLRSLKKHSTIVTTLFQASGIAESRTGFLNVTKFDDGKISFGSAAPSSSLVSNLVGSIAARPYNISVLQVTSVVVPPGIDGLNTTQPVASPPPPPTAAAPTPSAKSPPPPAANAPPADSPVASAPADAPTAEAPVADAPAAEAPAADAPKGKDDEADEEAAKSSSGRVTVGACLALMAAVLLTNL